jgi:hypothetical protein
METFYEMYFDGDVEFNGDALEMLEYRHDWASFRFTIGLCKYFLFGMIPEVILHSRSQGKFPLDTPASQDTRVHHANLECSLQTRSRSVTTTTVAMTSTAGSWALA